MKVGNLLGLQVEVPTFLVFLVLAIILYHIYMTWNFNTFKNMGLSGPHPLPVLGNMHQLIKQGNFEFQLINRQKYGKLHGIFMGRQPILVVHDLDILRQVLVKEFPNFRNKMGGELLNANDPFSRMLMILRDEHWKHIRNTLTPFFTAGKLKTMTTQINRCADHLVQHIGDKSSNLDKEIELKQLMGCYTMDVIASTVFGLDLDSHNNPDNKFLVNSKRLNEITMDSPTFLILQFFPFLKNLITKIMPIFPKDIAEFYKNIALEFVRDRKQKKSESEVDFMQLMADQIVDENDKNSVTEPNGIVWNKTGFTAMDIVGSAAALLTAGYDTTSSTMCFILYNLAVHQQCQDRVVREIHDVMQNKEAEHEDLAKMSYLQQVIDETLRLYPQAPMTDRIVGKDIIINDFHLCKGLQIGIPIYSLHMDPRVWPDPDKFDPERFTTEQKASRDPLYYMPFGYGPRNCIGMRLALMEMKIAVIKILQKYRLVTCDKTQIPLMLNKMRTTPQDGAWIKIQPRN